jgi:hypothetical protein
MTHCLKDNNDEWYDAGGDGSVFYALIEQADPKQRNSSAGHNGKLQ